MSPIRNMPLLFASGYQVQYILIKINFMLIIFYCPIRISRWFDKNNKISFGNNCVTLLLPWKVNCFINHQNTRHKAHRNCAQLENTLSVSARSYLTQPRATPDQYHTIE